MYIVFFIVEVTSEQKEQHSWIVEIWLELLPVCHYVSIYCIHGMRNTKIANMASCII